MCGLECACLHYRKADRRIPMKHRSLRTWALCCLSALLVLYALTACTIEGGVPTETPTAPLALNPLPTSAEVAETAAAREDTWTIGLLDPPADLYPYPQNAGAQRVAAPLVELVFPSPILALGYHYTTTGVLDRIPTIENGDAQLRAVDVYLDAAGNITTTVTEVVTQVEQLSVTYRWNQRLRWSDGQPVTADDSVFAYELAKAAPPSIEISDRLQQLVAYEKVDDYTTRAVLQPDIIGPTYFLNYWTPLPRHLLKDIPPDQVRASPFAQRPIGYGPYVIVDRSPTTVQMVRNEHYFGAQPPVSRLNVAFFPSVDALRASVLSGKLDVAWSDRVPADQFSFLDQGKSSGLADVIYLPNPVWEHIDFNLDVPVLQDIKLRHAIAFGLNRQAMVDELFQGHSHVIESWVLPGQVEAAPLDQIARYPYNPDEARRLLDEAGYVDPDGDGIRSSPDGLTLTLQLLTTEGNQVRERVASRFQQDMRSIGIEIEVLPIPAGQLFDPNGPLFQRQFELALFGWIAGPDPGGLLLWSCAAVPSESNAWSGDNFAGWCFREADRAIKAAVITLDPVKRKEAYLTQQQHWTRELPSLPLFQRLSVAILAPDVRHVQPDPLAPITWNVTSWRRMR